MPEKPLFQLNLFDGPEEPSSPECADTPGTAQAVAGTAATPPPDATPALQPGAAVLEWDHSGPKEKIERLRLECSACTACDLAQTRTHVVFGEGNVSSPLVIIGEGPGEQEDATGRPFVGRAGGLLDQALRENGLLHQHIWITNIVKCRACLVEGRYTRNRPPRVEEVDACRLWLETELSILSPLVILCLGGPSASWAIHPDFRITRERGQWLSSPWAKFAMATLHPAYVLRQQGAAFDESRAALVKDIGEARRKVIELRKAITDP